MQHLLLYRQLVYQQACLEELGISVKTMSGERRL